jgi:uncharacterized membrane protein YdfJ with MMPL/SSD domain
MHRKMIEPDLDRKCSRWVAKVRCAVPALVVIAALGGLVGVAVTVVPFGSAAEAQESPPGLQPPVQKWLKDRETQQIELNNALVAIVRKQIGDPAAAQAACTRLSTAVRALSRQGAAPERRVDQLTRAGLAKFEQASRACLAGDRANAERLVTEGLAERAAAQESLDEVLDGE